MAVNQDLVALITGILGFISSIVTLLIFFIRFKGGEQRKIVSSIDTDTATTAQKLVESAGTLTNIYDKQLADCHSEIRELSEKLQQLQQLVNNLSNLDSKNTDLIKRLLYGINLLVTQLKECGLIPVWESSKIDLKLFINDNP